MNPKFNKDKIKENKNTTVTTTRNAILHKQNLRRPKTNTTKLLQDATNPYDPGPTTSKTPGNSNDEPEQ